MLETSLLSLGLLKRLLKSDHLLIASLKPPATLSKMVDRTHEDSVRALEFLRATSPICSICWRLVISAITAATAATHRCAVNLIERCLPHLCFNFF
jgi:hypothetical protein